MGVLAIRVPRIVGVLAIRLTRNNLAVVLGNSGQVNEALRLLREVIDDPERPESAHPIYDRLTHNLGHYLMAAGDGHAAEPLLAAVLSSRRRTLGANHRDTLRTEWTLAETWLADGRQEQALTAFAAVVEKAGSALGPDHTDVNLYKRELAKIQQTTGANQ